MSEWNEAQAAFHDWDNTRPGHFFLIRTERADAPSYVIAEAASWGEVEPWFAPHSVCISRDEAMASDEYRAALLEWEIGATARREAYWKRADEAWDQQSSFEMAQGLHPLLDVALAAQWQRIQAELAEDGFEEPEPTFVEQAADLIRDGWVSVELDEREVALLLAVRGLAAARMLQPPATIADDLPWAALHEAVKAVELQTAPKRME